MTPSIEAPYSKESEMMVLGCMLTRENALHIGSKVLDESDFYLSQHKVIIKALKEINKEGKSADIHIICQELKKTNRLDSAGDIGYITGLAQYAGTSVYIEEYIDILKECSNKRKLLELSAEIVKKVTEGKEKAKKITIDTQEKLKLIEKSKGSKEKFPIRFLDKFEQNFLLTNPQKKPMLLEYMNDDGKTKMGFLPKSIVAMLVGAGGVGKTTLLAQLAISIATGIPFLNSFSTTHQCGENGHGNVFLGLGENQYDDIHRILHKASKNLRKDQPDLLDNTLFEASKKIAPFSFSGQQASFLEEGKPSLYFRELKMRLEDMAPQNGWDIIILDPISRIMGIDAETDNASATQFIALMEELSIDLPGNPTILLSHHVNKSALGQGSDQTQAASRGSSAFSDGVRWQCNYITEPQKEGVEKISVLKMTKSNFTAIFPEIKTKKDSDGFIEVITEKRPKSFGQNDKYERESHSK